MQKLELKTHILEKFKSKINFAHIFIGKAM